MKRFFRIIFAVLMTVLISSSFAPVSAEYPWVPYKGFSIVDQNQTKQCFTFNKNAVKGFGSKSKCTYECETQVYNKNFADYKNGYRYSNLPHSYIDTQKCDFWPFASSAVDNFTMGSAEAGAIKEEKEYNVYIELKPGSVKSASVKIKGQIGHRRVDLS